MNILMMLFLPVVAHDPAPCPQDMTNTMKIQMVAANRHASIGNGPVGSSHGLIETGVLKMDKPEQGTSGQTVTAADSDDFLFYFSSHAQALGDTSGPTMTPWLELRPIGDIEQGVLTGASEAEPVTDEQACSQSAAHVSAPGASRFSGEI